MMGLSIIVPYRNRQRCIDVCFNSISKQVVDFPLEVVLVDHHSTDDSMAYIRDQWRSMEGLSVYRYMPKVAFNLARARNIGIHLAKYSLVFTFDIDSVFLRYNALQHIYDLWKTYELTAMVGGASCLEGLAAPHLTKSEKIDWSSLKYRKNGLVLRTVGWGNCVFHKDLFYLVGGLNHNKFKGKGYEDMAFFLLAFRHGCYAVQVYHMSNRKDNDWIVNCKDHDLPKHLRVEMNDEWEGGCDDKAKEKSYKKFRQLVEKRPMVMHNDINFEDLVGETEKLI